MSVWHCFVPLRSFNPFSCQQQQKNPVSDWSDHIMLIMFSTWNVSIGKWKFAKTVTMSILTGVEQDFNFFNFLKFVDDFLWLEERWGPWCSHSVCAY